MMTFLAGWSLITTACVNELDTELNQTCDTACTIIEGRFTTEDGTVGIAQVPLALSWSTFFMFSGSRRDIATTQTDEQGYYTLRFYARDDELTKGDFSIQYTEPKGFITGDNYVGIYVDRRDTTVTRNVYLPTQGALRLVIANPEDISADDFLSVSTHYKVSDLAINAQARSGGLDTRYSTTSEMTAIASGNQYNYIRIQKKKDSVARSINDSIYVPVDRTPTYRITF